jgi:hypothetical protein
VQYQIGVAVGLPLAVDDQRPRGRERSAVERRCHRLIARVGCEGRDGLTPVFEDLKQYEATTHFNGQSTVELDGDRATGESYTIAHHVSTVDGTRKIMIAALRYRDTFAKVDGQWYFAERNLILDWSETRALGT